MIYRVIILVASVILSLSSFAETTENRPVTSIYSLEIGGARDISTYLSPLPYSGEEYTISGSWSKDFQRWSDQCAMRFEADASFGDMLNPAKTARMVSLTARFGWGLMWKHDFNSKWRITVGPMLDIYGGALYLLRNGNNPVTALASIGVDASAAGYYKFKIGKIPATLCDELRIPTLSGFFCPQYGESYYEIYLGNHHNLAHFGWWGNAGGVDNLLSLRLQLGRTGMMLGYRVDWRIFNANHLATHLLRNAFVIGIIP